MMDTHAPLSDSSLPHRIRRFYERVTREGSAALEELPDLYTDDVDFANPVEHERGLEAFRALWLKAFRMYKVFEFHDLEVTGTEEHFAMNYSMAVQFSFGPVFRSPMASTFYGRDGKVYLTRDYFDPLGSILSPSRLLTWLYQKLFGILVA
jgi:ketosteroid isomerase-like protein